MTDYLKPLPFIAIVVFFVYMVSSTAPRNQLKANSDPAKQTPTVREAARHGDDTPVTTIRVKQVDGPTKATIDIYPSGDIMVRRDGSATSPGTSSGSATSSRFEVEFNRVAVMSDYNWDIGAWASFRLNKQDRESVFDAGLRISPARFLYGTIAPDLLISPYAAGFGASFYLPDDVKAGFWNRIGVGIGYIADFHGKTGFVPYVALSTRF